MTSRQQKKRSQDDNDGFMTLPDKEITECITEIGFNFSVEELRNPNPQQVQNVFAWFVELYTNTTREVVAPAMRAAARNMCGNQADEIFPPSTREYMAAFVTMRKLLSECGITDFTLADLSSPSYPRLAKIFSHLINFTRFRETMTGVIDEHSNNYEQVKSRTEQLSGLNEEKKKKIALMLEENESIEQAIKEKENYEQSLKTDLLGLKRQQERVSQRAEQAQARYTELKTMRANRAKDLLALRTAIEELRPYADVSPERLQESLLHLNTSLHEQQTKIADLDKQFHALETSYNSFILLESEIASLSRLLTEVQKGLQQEQEAASSAAKHREELTEKSNNAREKEYQEKLLLKQLDQVRERIENFKQEADKKKAKAAARTEDLTADIRKYSSMQREHNEEIEKRKARIELTQKKIAELKEQIEDEVQRAREESMKLTSQVRLYIAEMDRSIK